MGASIKDTMPAIYNGDGRLTQDQIDCFTEVFREFDYDQSGAISTNEFRKVCEGVGFNPTADQLDAMIAELDQDGSGDIDLNEFLVAMQAKLQDAEGEEIVTEAFRMFDMDGSGALDHKEMEVILSNMGEMMSQEDIDALIETVDADGDGEVDLKEFLAVVLDRAAV